MPKKKGLSNKPTVSQAERRRQYREYMKEKREAEQAVAERLQKELGAEYTISDEDANWSGLE